MPDLRRSLPDTIALVRRHNGFTWPNPWWPGASSAQQDCAALVSWALFDLKGTVPYYTVVSGIQNWGKTQGVYHAGSAGIQVGDVIGFDWEGDGVYNHTEICTAVAPRTVTSIGTNSNPGDDVRERIRSRNLILSYIRPPYPGASVAATTRRKRKSMPFLTKDTSTTHFLVTDLGMYVVPTQLLAECIDRVINYTPTRADLDYYNTLVLGPRYGNGSATGLPAVGTTTIDQAALKAALAAAMENAQNQSPDDIARANEMNPL